MMNLELEQLREAEKSLKKALELDPENQVIERNLRIVKGQLLQHRLFEKGLLTEIKPPITDFTPYKNRKPIRVKRKPLSEIIIEERR